MKTKKETKKVTKVDAKKTVKKTSTKEPKKATKKAPKKEVKKDVKKEVEKEVKKVVKNDTKKKTSDKKTENPSKPTTNGKLVIKNHGYPQGQEGLGLVKKVITRRFYGTMNSRVFNIDDLIQEGMVAYFRAKKAFAESIYLKENPDKSWEDMPPDYKGLENYVCQAIFLQINDFVNSSFDYIHIPKSLRKRFGILNNYENTIGRDINESDIPALAKLIGKETFGKEDLEMYNSYKTAVYINIDAEETKFDDKVSSVAEGVAEPEPEPEIDRNKAQRFIKTVLFRGLTEVQADVVCMKFGIGQEKMSSKDIGKKYGCSYERINYLYLTDAMEKIKQNAVDCGYSQMNDLMSILLKDKYNYD